MLNIALDGPAGSGKSTIAKQLSKSLGILYLDTGAMYRACALKAKKLGIASNDEEKVNTFINDVNIAVKYVDGAQKTYLDGEDVSTAIRENEISMMASNISAIKSVRLKLVELQREIAKVTDCVLDGRDIGTHVLPNANYKFFVTASLDVRAERRYLELVARGQTVDKDALKKEMEIRDYNDSHREFAPLKQAEDAILLDTSNMSIEVVINTVISYINR